MNKSKILRIISSCIAVIFFFSIATASGCDPFGDTLTDKQLSFSEYLHNERPEGIDKYDDIVYSINQDEIDKIKSGNHLSSRAQEEELVDYEYSMLTKWDERICELEDDGMTREEAVREAAIEELIDVKDMNRDEAEEYYEEHWRDNSVEETEETSEEVTSETTETSETSSGGFSPQVLAWFDYLRGKWEVPHGTADFGAIVDWWLSIEIYDGFSVDPVTGDLLYTNPETGVLETKYHKVDENNCIQYGVESGNETSMKRIL